MKRLVQSALGRLGLRLVRKGRPKTVAERYPDIEESFLSGVYEACRQHTLTPAVRMYSLYQAVRYCSATGVAGAFVECGVWKGGSSMVAAMALLELGDTGRDLYLYDTFAGMSEPTARDIDHRGRSAEPTWRHSERDAHNEWCFSPIEEVRRNLASTGYPADRVKLIEGRVEATIPAVVPERIAVLRLDTDWYESTRHELEHLFPRLSPGGVLIVDDYGYWRGARDAVDEFLEAGQVPLLLHRIDATCRVGVKSLVP